MLGLRLGAELEARLDRFAAESRRTKSDIARQAVREYIERRSVDPELQRQLHRVRVATTERQLDELEAFAADVGDGRHHDSGSDG